MADEDMKFPWFDLWQRGQFTFRMLVMLSKLKTENADRVLPALLTYLDRGG